MKIIQVKIIVELGSGRVSHPCYAGGNANLETVSDAAR